MGLTTWMVIGAILGFVARQVVPGQDRGRFVVIILLGMAGASTAGFVAGGPWAEALGPWSVLVATRGVVGVLHLYGLIARRTVGSRRARR